MDSHKGSDSDVVSCCVSDNSQLVLATGHDIKNALQVITCCVSILKDGGEHKALGKQVALLQLEEAVDMVSALTERMVSETLEVEAPEESVDVAKLLKKMHSMWSSIAGRKIDIRSRIPDSLPRVFAKPTDIRSAVMDLVVNACEAIQGAGKIEISAGHSLASELSTRAKNSHLWIRVSDDGCGIQTTELRKIFEAGYSAKESNRGQGLHNARNVIRKLGGDITVNSVWQRGSTFTILIPVESIG